MGGIKRLLISPEHLQALDLAADLDLTPKNLKRVTLATNEAVARWAFLQWELRKRAAGRFPEAEKLLFVREALEQATHFELARYHATVFPAAVKVVDLTTGIGGDLLAFAERGPVIGFERDAERAAYATWNLNVRQLVGEIRNEDGLEAAQRQGFPYVFSDPARRVEGKRTLQLEDFSPDPIAIVAATSKAKRWAMKLTPMLGDDLLKSLAPRIEFVSVGGECREVLLLGGLDPLASGVFAVRPGSEPLQGDGPLLEPTFTPQAWFYDADPAAVRAHALGTLAESHQLTAVGDQPGYLTGANYVETPWLRAYRVIDIVAPKKLRSALKALEAGSPILKQRGAKQDLDRWRKELGRHGDRPVTVAFYTEGASLRAVLMEPEYRP